MNWRDLELWSKPPNPGWILSWKHPDNWDSWTFSYPFLQVHCYFSASWGRGLMNISPCCTINWYMKPVEQQSENLRGAACDNNRRTAPEGSKCLNPPFIRHYHHVSSWITKWGRRLPTLRANKHVSPAQTEVLCLSEPIWSPWTPTPVWYFGQRRVGLFTRWAEGNTLLGQEGVIQPLLALSQYLPSGSGFGGGMISLQGHIPTLLSEVAWATSLRGCKQPSPGSTTAFSRLHLDANWHAVAMSLFLVFFLIVVWSFP